MTMNLRNARQFTPHKTETFCGTSPRHPHARSLVLGNVFDELASFKQLEDRIAALSTERARGAAFEVFAEAWLATQRLSQAQNIWPADSVPSEIQCKLRLPLKDMGVDGVFDTPLHEYVCYQAKFRTGRPSLAWGEIATFFGLADFAAQRLLFTNCDDVSEIAEQRRDVVFVRGSDLDFPMLVPGFLGALAWLDASRRKVGSRPTLHSGMILHRGLLGALLCAAAPLANPFGVSLAHERPRRLVIGHVLLHGHARNGAADQAIVTASALKNRNSVQAAPTSRCA